MLKTQLAELLGKGDSPEAILAEIKRQIGVANIAATPTLAAPKAPKAEGSVGTAAPKATRTKRTLAAPKSFCTLPGKRPGFINLYLYAEDVHQDGAPSTAGYGKGTDGYNELMAAGFRWAGSTGNWWGSESVLPDTYKFDE